MTSFFLFLSDVFKWSSDVEATIKYIGKNDMLKITQALMPKKG